MAKFGPVPASLKRVQPYLKIAEDHETKDIVIAYWCRLYAVQMCLKNEKSKEDSIFLIGIMDWLEKVKKENANNEAITNEVVAQAHIENHALKLFMFADNEDRSGRFNKNVVKVFYTVGLIYDVVSVFGEVSDEVAHHKKYAKWKATYIHNCLKNGIIPVAGPVAMEGEEGFSEEFSGTSNAGSSNFNFRPTESSSDSAGSTMPFPNAQPPYPTGGLFSNEGFQPMSLVPPVPGAHAPPSTPNGSSQVSPSALPTADDDIPSEQSTGGISLRPEDFHKAQKLCKYAGSALQYEDVSTAVDYLQKALLLLTTGKEN